MANQMPPGWYPDAQGTQRWWDGRAWTSHVQPASTGTELAPAPPHPTAEVATATPAPPAGWRDDLTHPGLVRYWDGTRWTEQTHPARGRLLENYLGITLYENEIWRGQIGGSLVGAKADVATQGQITQRVTATRLVALGVFALAVPKKGGNQIAVLHVEAPTFELVHPVAATGKIQPWAKLANISQYINNRRHALAQFEVLKPQPVVVVGSDSSVADELHKLAELRDRRLLTEEEFAQQKTALLNRGTAR